MMNNINIPLVSICIPTNNRPDIIRETILSIIEENVGNDLLNICITDNSPTNETKELIEKEFKDVTYIKYKKTHCEGFLNSVEALKFGNGRFLKLHNDYSKFKKGQLIKFIDRIKKNKNEKPLIFFSFGALNKNKKVEIFDTFDNFLYNIHYYSTWSSAFGIWKNDFIKLYNENIKIDYMFPHTSFLFNLTYKKKYIVDDTKYIENIPLKKKGGYNLTNNFVRLYLSMVKELLDMKCISFRTYNKIEKGIIKFVAFWWNQVLFNNEVFYFTFDNTEKIIREVCGNKSVRMYIYWKNIYYIKFSIKRLKKKCKSVFKVFDYSKNS